MHKWTFMRIFLFPAAAVFFLCELSCQNPAQNKTTNSPGTIMDQYRPYLAAEYLFDGNANDSSGYNNHGTVYWATLTNDRLGRSGKAYFFSPTNTNYIDFGSGLAQMYMSAMSLAFWFRTTNTNVLGRMMGTRGSTSGGWEIDVIPGSIRFTRYNLVITTFPLSLLPTNTWACIVMTWSADSNVNIYSNGGWFTNITNYGMFITNNASFCAGRASWTNAYYYDGMLDNIRVYNTVIPTNLIQALYAEEY